MNTREQNIRSFTSNSCIFTQIAVVMNTNCKLSDRVEIVRLAYNLQSAKVHTPFFEFTANAQLNFEKEGFDFFDISAV